MATPVEICDGSIAENLNRLVSMVEDAKILVEHIGVELGVES